MIRKPYYIIKFSACECRFEIRVNDQPIIQMNVADGQVSSQAPINHAISESGITEISISVLPVIGSTQFSDATAFSYDCHLYDVQNGFMHKETYEGYKSPKITDDRLLSSLASSKKMEVAVNYTLNALWTEGKDLGDVDDIEKKLRMVYLEIGNTVQSKKYEIFKQKLSNREQNMATSMYLSPVDSRARLNSLIHDFDNGFDQMTLSEDAVVVYSAYGKKASLKKVTGEPALCFEKKDPLEHLMLDLEFYWSKETGQFEII
ncbi:hypothetical protein [Aquimarina sediminis]|uniref:hypothetical protein n=1 Tax=Aquimarina sediminis TaxID=2070536 RepID=UPI000FFF137E|nr:hypothetical protein [Aquimarina sediminis]